MAESVNMLKVIRKQLIKHVSENTRFQSIDEETVIVSKPCAKTCITQRIKRCRCWTLLIAIIVGYYGICQHVTGNKNLWL